MDSATILMEGGEWISVNEEAAFMAKMFPSSSSANSELEMSSFSLSSSCYSGHESNISMPGVDTNSFYSNDTDSNLYSLSQGSSYGGSSENAAYHSHENYYLSDPQQFLAVNGSSLPIDFNLCDTKSFIQMLQCNQMAINHELNLETSCDNLDQSGAVPAQPEHLPEIEPASEKINESSECGRKRSRIPEAQKGKRNVRSKRSHGLDSDDDTNALVQDRQNSGVVSSEGESDGPQEPSGGCSNETVAADLTCKTRASRGSATDPQSLYARKRRARINERLRILQKLVPNGTKVDISTMLEEAVHYVKFMQLQIKLLSSDDHWMYAPLAYNGMDIGLSSKINTLL